jgi:exopolysaccharide production protein ExoZ
MSGGIVQEQVSGKSERSDKLDGIQFGRGVAACLVVLFHAGRMLTLPQYARHDFLGTSLFSFGNAGVDFFFVLSGFVIFYVHQRDIGRPGRLLHYLWRRVTRIYPMYWVVTALIVAMAIAKGDWAALTFNHIVMSVLLLPNYQNPLLDVGWTLTHEVLFYAVFAVAILSRPVGIFIGLIWLGLVMTGLFAPSNIMFLRFIADPYHFEFAFGILAALATNRFKSSGAWMAALIGLALFAGTAGLVDWHTLNSAETLCRLLFGVASGLILYGVSVSEKLGQIRFPKWAAYLGAASYSIYLMHTIIVGLAARVIFKIQAAHDLPNIAFLLAAAIAIAAGCAAYQFVENPLQRAVRHTRLRLHNVRVAVSRP